MNILQIRNSTINFIFFKIILFWNVLIYFTINCWAFIEFVQNQLSFYLQKKLYAYIFLKLLTNKYLINQSIFNQFYMKEYYKLKKFDIKNVIIIYFNKILLNQNLTTFHAFIFQINDLILKCFNIYLLLLFIKLLKGFSFGLN